ncbi:hypothetical protein ACJRO7_013088 [Eucalyptus globulus]|uniref:Uncharacterized protein n=1 Tax=Eucalyptus globulus TaxID=34317 RepID=A0ABD3LP45_EUCGL
MFQDDGSSSVTSSPLQLCPMMPLLLGFGSPHSLLKELESKERLASPDGDTMQQITAYFSESLANRILKSWPGLHKPFNSTKKSLLPYEFLVRKLFFELFPFLESAFVVPYRAIMEAMELEKMWFALLQSLNGRPEGPPVLRITGIHQHKEALDFMARILTEEAELLGITFPFNPIVSKLESLEIEKLLLQLRTLLAFDDERHRKRSPLPLMSIYGTNSRSLTEEPKTRSVNCLRKTWQMGVAQVLIQLGRCQMDNFLNALWGLSPNVMVRLPKGRERHKKLDKWIHRLDLAAYGNVPLSSYGRLQVRRPMQ